MRKRDRVRPLYSTLTATIAVGRFWRISPPSFLKPSISMLSHFGALNRIDKVVKLRNRTFWSTGNLPLCDARMSGSINSYMPGDIARDFAGNLLFYALTKLRFQSAGPAMHLTPTLNSGDRGSRRFYHAGCDCVCLALNPKGVTLCLPPVRTAYATWQEECHPSGGSSGFGSSLGPRFARSCFGRR